MTRRGAASCCHLRIPGLSRRVQKAEEKPPQGKGPRPSLFSRLANRWRTRRSRQLLHIAATIALRKIIRRDSLRRSFFVSRTSLESQLSSSQFRQRDGRIIPTSYFFNIGDYCYFPRLIFSCIHMIILKLNFNIKRIITI